MKSSGVLCAYAMRVLWAWVCASVLCCVACLVPWLWVSPGVVGRPWICFTVVWYVGGALSLALLCALVDIVFESIFVTFYLQSA